MRMSTLPPGFRPTKQPLSFLDSPHSGETHGYCDVQRRPATGPGLCSPKADKWVSPQFSNTATPRRTQRQSTRSGLRQRRNSPVPKKQQRSGRSSSSSSQQQPGQRRMLTRKPSLTLVTSKPKSKPRRVVVQDAVSDFLPADGAELYASDLPLGGPDAFRGGAEDRRSCSQELPLHRRVGPEWVKDVRLRSVGLAAAQSHDPASILVMETPHGHDQRSQRQRRCRERGGGRRQVIPATPCSHSRSQ